MEAGQIATAELKQSNINKLLCFYYLKQIRSSLWGLASNGVLWKKRPLVEGACLNKLIPSFTTEKQKRNPFSKLTAQTAHLKSLP